MIDWKTLCTQLAVVVNAHEKGRMIKDKKLAWKLAREILDLAKKEK